MPETKGELSHHVLPYFNIRDELSVYDGVVVRGERVVVPKTSCIVSTMLTVEL